jgi:transcriptional regulator with XRE-family HTH domain
VLFLVLHNHLEALRTKANMTYKELAQICNVSEQTISRVFKGETSEPAFSVVSNIVVACGGSLDEIAGIREIGETKSPIESIREQYEDRIACIKAEHREHIRELNEHSERKLAEAAQREAALNKSSDRKTYFTLAITAALMVTQAVLDVILLRSLYGV